MPKIAPVLICVGITAACFWCGLAAILDAGRPPAAAPRRAPSSRGSELAPARFQSATRSAVEPSEVPATRPLAHEPLDFDAVVDELVGIGVAMWAALDSGDRDGVLERNDAAEALLQRLHVGCPAAGELALDRLTRLGADLPSLEVRVRRHVLERILRDALTARHAVSEPGQRGPLDELVAAMLATLPQGEELARGLGGRLLVDTPFLGPAHERAVLELADFVPDMPFLEPIVAGLLRTLWQNLEATGARSTARLASLAMLFADDANPARRLAAVQQLLHDVRYRDFAVAHVVRSGDRDLARELAQTASAELPPAAALDVLRTLEDVGGDELLGAWLLLGSRDSTLLARQYEQVLGDGTRPRLRAALVTGACARGDPGALEVASIAFEHDPDPDVRLRALYALAGHPDTGVAERALAAALDDPRAARDPGWVASVALALRNFAASGAANGLARLGARLERHPLLQASDRSALRALLAEHVPGHR